MELLWIAIAGVAGAGAGEGLRRWLNTLSYRLPPTAGDLPPTGGDPPPTDSEAPETAETALPHPGRRYWIPVALGLAWAGAAWRIGVGESATDWVRLVAWLAFTLVGAWLAAIDLDVQRLPDRGQATLAAIAVAGAVVLAWAQPTRLLIGLAAGAVCGLAFLIVHVISRGSLGFGDVKLVVTCGFWLGVGPVTAVYAALLAGCAMAVAYSLLTHRRRFAFGPWLVAGTVVAGLALGAP